MPVWLTSACAATLAVLGLALSPPGTAEPARGRHHIGPVDLTLRVQLRNAGVDTNVFQTLSDPIRDAVVVLSPRLDAYLPAGRRLRFTGMTFLELHYFRRQGDESSTDYYGEGKGELDLGPFTLYGGGGGGHFMQRFSIDVDDRLERQESHGYAGLTWRVTRRLSATAQGRRDLAVFEPGTFRLGGDVKEAMDRRALSASGQLRFALTSRTTLLMSGEAMEDLFFSQPAEIPQERRSYRYLGGFEFSKRALFSGRLLAGIRDFPGTLAQGSPPYRGPVLSADLVWPIRQWLQLHAIGERDVLYASSLVDLGALRYRNAFVLNRYQVDALADLPLGLLAMASFSFEQARYLLPYPNPTPRNLAERVDHRYIVGGGIARRFGDVFRIGGHVSWARRVSSLPSFSYEGLRYGLTAEVLP